MKHLLVYAHPNPKGFSHAILETLVEALKPHHDIRIRDLYAMHFDPVLRASDFEAFEKGTVPGDLQIEQDHVRWADVITFIYPLWWSGLPAILKGYVDRVFSIGFAYTYEETGPRGLLAGKKVFMITPMGATVDLYEKIGMISSMKLTIDQGFAEFCGLELLGHRYFGNVPSASDEERKTMLEEIKQTVETWK